MIKVLNPGLLSSIQDEGRFGYRSMGVPAGGSMDSIASKLANDLVGNLTKAGVIEFTWQGPKLEFQADTEIAITGADFPIYIDEKRIRINSCIVVKTGQKLSFGPPLKGLRGYIAVKGGINTDQVLSSVSFYKDITKQSNLQKNDILPIGNKSAEQVKKVDKPSSTYVEQEILTCFKGPEFHMLSKSLQNYLSHNSFQISTKSNRMSYVLSTNATIRGEEILSSTVQAGTVQLTPGGELIILMRDCQTTGGYSRILQLDEYSICILSQKRPNQYVKFGF